MRKRGTSQVCRQLLESGEDKKTDSFLQFEEENSALLHLDFSPVRLVLDF